MECSEYADILNKVGLPVLLLVALIYAIFKTFSWIAPRIDRYVNEYMDTAKRKANILEKSAQECAKHQSETAEYMRTVIDLVQKLER